MGAKSAKFLASQLYSGGARLQARGMPVPIPHLTWIGRYEARIDMAKVGGGRGHVNFFFLPDMLVMFGEGANFARVGGPEFVIDEPAIDFLINLGGAVEGQGVVQADVPSITSLLRVSRDALPTAGSRLMLARFVYFSCLASRFSRKFDLSKAEHPPALRQALESPRVNQILSHNALDGAVAAMASELLNCPYSGASRRLFVQGKVSEIVGWVLRAMSEAASGLPPSEHKAHDQAAIMRVHGVLSRKFVRPPAIEDLARMVGLGETKLRALFQSTFGVNPQEFCLEKRMQEAQHLLLSGKLSIQQVAARLGYGRQSSFTNAFTRRYGHPPRELRLRRRD